MRENPSWQRQARGHQEGRPIDSVKAQDILADHMQIGWPEFGVPFGIAEFTVGWPSGRGQIVGQRIKPYIHHMRVVIRHRNAP